MRTNLIIFALSLILSITASAQTWIELYNPDIPTLYNNVPQTCSPILGRQYHCWPWHVAPSTEWQVSSSDDVDIDLISVYLLSEWSIGDETQQCPSGWWDGMMINAGIFSIKAMDGPHATFSPDSLTGDLHWLPRQQEPIDNMVPIGNWHFSFIPNTLLIAGLAPDFSEAEVVSVYRSSNAVIIYIGPIFTLSDFNRDGVVETNDIFAFLSCWFGMGYRADYDTNNVVNVSDIFIFLALWFSEQ